MLNEVLLSQSMLVQVITNSVVSNSDFLFGDCSGRAIASVLLSIENIVYVIINNTQGNFLRSSKLTNDR